jgi:hypothetical protein
MACQRVHRGKAGDLAALRKRLWFGVLRASDILEDPEASPELALKACHALGQLGGCYANLLKTSELEARLTALEQALLRRNGHAV